MIPDSVVKVKNAPEIGWQYVDAMLDPEPQLKFAKLITIPMTNQGRFPARTRNDSRPGKDPASALREARGGDPRMGRSLEPRIRG